MVDGATAWERWRWDGQILVMLSRHAARFSGCWQLPARVSHSLETHYYLVSIPHLGLDVGHSPEGCGRKKFPATSTSGDVDLSCSGLTGQPSLASIHDCLFPAFRSTHSLKDAGLLALSGGFIHPQIPPTSHLASQRLHELKGTMADQKKRKRSSRPNGDAATPGAKRQATEKSQPVFAWKEAKQLKAANPPFIRKSEQHPVPSTLG